MKTPDTPVLGCQRRMRDIRIIPTMKAGEFVIRLIGVTELDRLLNAGAITAEQYDAGNRLASDRYGSGICGRGASWHEGGAPAWRGSFFEQMNETREEAWRRYSTAIKTLPQSCAREVRDVVLDNRPCSDLRRLHDGLQILVTFYLTRFLSFHD